MLFVAGFLLFYILLSLFVYISSNMINGYSTLASYVIKFSNLLRVNAFCKSSILINNVGILVKTLFVEF